MSYTALYRKFRPAEFGDVKGQDHIITTLQNQIKANRIGHAYLFCGTRGTGKTTVAKIFAKAVNCEHPVDGEVGAHIPQELDVVERQKPFCVVDHHGSVILKGQEFFKDLFEFFAVFRNPFLGHDLTQVLSARGVPDHGGSTADQGNGSVPVALHVRHHHNLDEVPNVQAVCRRVKANIKGDLFAAQ